ncbi:MAG: Cobalt chelatase (CbiK) [Methanosaeta sp. PtaU1.Bin112]|nr:MAG: Cobalt chelatase (CbiK) [Methanosaeta sp. PtaU1.Bin112]
MPEGEKTGIVLAPYGTAFPPALATYSRIQESYEREFPGSTIRLSFASNLMRKRLREKEGINIQSPQSALEELCDEGHRRLVVQSLQIVPGEEFHQVAAQAMEMKRKAVAFSRLEIGLPLLSGLPDCRKVSSLIYALCHENGSHRSREMEAVLLVGHGTGHAADALYSLLQQIIRKEHGNVFLATIDGFYDIAGLLPELMGSGARVVRIMPFLLVAGGHAENDLFGPGPASCKSILEKEGYEVVADRRGLGDSEEIVTLYQEHTRNALENIRSL